MKRWGVIIAVALTLLVRVKEVRAQIITSEPTTNTNFSDPVICPDGCTAVTTTVYASGYVSTGTIYKDSKGNPVAVPGGYSEATILGYSLGQTPTPSTDNRTGGGGGEAPATGTLGTRYADGRYAGFYKAPNGKYYPIAVGTGSTRKARVKDKVTLNCPDSTEPYFGEDADVTIKCCRDCPVGNRVKKEYLKNCGYDANCRTMLVSCTCEPVGVAYGCNNVKKSQREYREKANEANG